MSAVEDNPTRANDDNAPACVERTPERAPEREREDDASPSSVEDAMRGLALADASNDCAVLEPRARHTRFRSPTDAKMSPASKFVARKAHYAEPTSIEEIIRERENDAAVAKMPAIANRSRFAPKP